MDHNIFKCLVCQIVSYVISCACNKYHSPHTEEEPKNEDEDVNMDEDDEKDDNGDTRNRDQDGNEDQEKEKEKEKEEGGNNEEFNYYILCLYISFWARLRANLLV